MKEMKPLCLITLLILFLQCSFLKDDKLENAWTLVKATSLTKSEQGRRIASQSLFFNHVPDDVSNRALGWSARLRLSSDSRNVLDSSNFRLLRVGNDSLDFWMSKFFSHLLADVDTLVRPMYSEFQQDYLRSAKTVDSARLIFNKISKEKKSSYLFP